MVCSLLSCPTAVAPWRTSSTRCARPTPSSTAARNGQVERLNHTLKETTVQQYHYQDAAEPNARLQTFYKHLMRLYVPNSPKILVSLYETQPMTLRDYTRALSPAVPGHKGWGQSDARRMVA